MLKSSCKLAAFIVGLLIAAAPFATSAMAQDWPQRPVRFILPFGPGSAADTLARVLGERAGASRWW